MRLTKIFIVICSLIVSNHADTGFFDDIIEEVNSKDLTWKAGKNHITDMGRKATALLGTRLPAPEMRSLITRPRHHWVHEDLPESFDSREQWSGCQSLWSIKDQGACGTCWAVSTASAMSDRVCIASGGQTQVNISAEQLAACCTDCGLGCNGGYPDMAWPYFLEHGLVTGGDYNSLEGCQPYEVPPTGKSAPDMYLRCSPKKCTNKNYGRNYKDDLHYGKTAYYLPNDEYAIQSEIYNYGSVVAGFTVYIDFFAYSSGVYKRNSTEKLGGHAVRMLGWGVENGVKYWHIANSWNRGWGDNGYFKIIRGINDCGIEEFVTAGQVEPK